MSILANNFNAELPGRFFFTGVSHGRNLGDSAIVTKAVEKSVRYAVFEISFREPVILELSATAFMGALAFALNRAQCRVKSMEYAPEANTVSVKVFL